KERLKALPAPIADRCPCSDTNNNHWSERHQKQKAFSPLSSGDCHSNSHCSMDLKKLLPSSNPPLQTKHHLCELFKQI
ncbi:GH23795, partial [Drosophila grimshawi]